MAKKSSPFYPPDTCRIIGVAGSAHGVGVTHFCISAANYLSSCLRKKTAVLEWNGHGDFEKMERACTGKNAEGKDFSVLDVSYFKDAGQEELVLCIESGYLYIVVDFGILTKEKQGEFLRCEKHVLVGSFSEWQEEEFLVYMKHQKGTEKGWIYAVSFGSMEMRREVTRKLKIPVLDIPFTVDAFTVTPIVLKFFQEFFEN